jgi:pyruvate,orthophosphate dikinase
VTLAYDLDHDFGLPLGELKNRIGGKAAGINVMATHLHLPVPPGFVVTTATCNEYLAHGWPDGLDAELREHMARTESVVGRRFGDPVDPLLVSVRSGAPISMPGMMDTILNLGLNEATTAGLARASGDPAFAADCLRRFREMYPRIVGVEAPEDPWLQLRGAVEAVFRSWNGERARTYRRHENIADDLGTAVTVQTMVFGNRGGDSGTGVLFTRSLTGEPIVEADVMFNAQGEDVVAGSSQVQKLADLDERLPAVADELRQYADRLERHYADMCDIEFTIEQGKLWMLQVRNGKRTARAALRIAIDMAEDPTFPLTRIDAVKRVANRLAHPPVVTRRAGVWPEPLAKGLSASPGIARGQIVVSPDQAVATAQPGRPIILVRTETSPEDVHGMELSAGILTATGGLNSHAAVVARGWEIPAVVGAEAIEVGDAGFAVQGRTFGCGEVITIDGGTGEVFAGGLDFSCDLAPEAATMLIWANELGIAIQPPEALADAEPEAADGATPVRELCEDDAVRGLMIKGMAAPDGLATSLGCPAEALPALLESLVAAEFATNSGGFYKLTPEGRLRAGEVFATERDSSGGEAGWLEALDVFVLLDKRMKVIVTAWQKGPNADDPNAYNDHSDAEFDARVLDDLGALDADVAAWLAPLQKRLPRLAAYATRLDHAARAARGGDARFVASPRVDSYHTVWFELHEDLMKLANRRREDETRAGRA